MNASVPPVKAAAAAPPRRPGQSLKLFAAAVFFAFAVPLLLLAGLLGWHQYRILTTWPAVDAVVTKAVWTTHTTNTAKPPITSYGARFSFHYNAGGRPYDASADLGYRSSTRSDIEHWTEQMPVGSHRRIRYDPHNPGNISLAVDYTPLAFAAPYTLAKWAGMIALVSVILYWLGWRRSRRTAV